jgi:hypothetical protein
MQDLRIAQDMEHRVGDPLRGVQIDIRIAGQHLARIHQIPQHREQVFVDALDHLAVDEGAGGRRLHLQLDAPFDRHYPDIEGGIAFQQFLAVVQVVAAVQHRQGTVAKQLIETALTGVEQFIDLDSGEHVQAALGHDHRVDHLVLPGIERQFVYSVHRAPP